MVIRHKFLHHQISPETEILILGTFNPDSKENPAEFFYGRGRNFLWRILSNHFQVDDLKPASVDQKRSFIREHKIDFIDLIAKVDAEDGQETNYADDYLDGKVVEWQDVIAVISKLQGLKKVGFTRKTYSGIPKMKNQVDAIKSHCMTKGIPFQALPTPARFLNAAKQSVWSEFLSR